MQGNLFNEDHTPDRFDRLGKSTVSYKATRSILTKASGFMSGYDFTLNPYSGCTFGCTYCYAAFFARDKNKQDHWGEWVTVKENALALMAKKKPGTLDNKTIYMSSVTDPYQPVEKKLGLTRSLLEHLVRYHQPRLVVQTRSPLVERDIDLFAGLEYSQINMTVTTDSEQVRQAFEPQCPSNRVRLKAIKAVARAGLNACITLTPLLPVADPHTFAKHLQDTGINRFVVQPFHATRGRFVAGTRDKALAMTREMSWDQERYQEVVQVLKEYLPHLGEGKDGFKPV